MRTAIIDEIVNEKAKQDKNYKPDHKDSHWELLAMGAVEKKKSGEIAAEIRKDPFIALKVADIFISDDFMRVGEVLNVRVNKNRGKIEKVGIQMFKEVLNGVINLNKPVEFEGEIRIDEILKINNSNYLPMTLTKDYIIKACNAFYTQEFEGKFEFATEMHDIINKLRVLLSVGKDEFIIRVGRFSGVTAVTINKFRKPHNRKWGNTKNLFEGMFPMGWVKVKFLT